MTQRICDCAYQFKNTSLPGCVAFSRKPDKCWNKTTVEEATKREEILADNKPVNLCRMRKAMVAAGWIKEEAQG
ncbi:MAG: hypothetical protein WC455_23495 [Dehalococcoidia bacterium]|jgi:hypothetical protein